MSNHFFISTIKFSCCHSCSFEILFNPKKSNYPKGREESEGVLLGHLWTVSSEFAQYLHAPYGSLKNNSYIKTILKELKFIKTAWGEEPQKCWEHKAINPISLVLMVCVRDFPCLSMLYAYYFDYTEIFLPFIHKVYPTYAEDNYTKLLDHNDPSWKQWTVFLLKCILAHQLITEFCILVHLLNTKFAWHGQETQYRTIGFITSHNFIKTSFHFDSLFTAIFLLTTGLNCVSYIDPILNLNARLMLQTEVNVLC
uniref:Uncharacterized protein n=1 Tax=Chrysemys picta bellii TaxID=8478 RepID=A0A8C3P805_CHRPI